MELNNNPQLTSDVSLTAILYTFVPFSRISRAESENHLISPRLRGFGDVVETGLVVVVAAVDGGPEVAGDGMRGSTS